MLIYTPPTQSGFRHVSLVEDNGELEIQINGQPAAFLNEDGCTFSIPTTTVKASSDGDYLTLTPQVSVFYMLKKVKTSICLIAVDANGRAYSDGYILKFKSDGTVYRYKDLNRTLGLTLDDIGRLQLD